MNLRALTALFILAEETPKPELGKILLIIALVALVVAVVWYITKSLFKAQDELGTFLAAAIGTLLVAKALEAGFAFLKDIDWGSVGKDLRSALEAAEREIKTQPSGLLRLEKAKSLLASGDEIEKDESAMLASATLELGLRSIAKRNRLAIAPDEDSLAGLAIRLARDGFITRSEQDLIRYYTAKVRNRVMHGDLGTIEPREVATLIEACHRFFTAHRLN